MWRPVQGRRRLHVLRRSHARCGDRAAAIPWAVAIPWPAADTGDRWLCRGMRAPHAGLRGVGVCMELSTHTHAHSTASTSHHVQHSHGFRWPCTEPFASVGVWLKHASADKGLAGVRQIRRSSALVSLPSFPLCSPPRSPRLTPRDRNDKHRARRPAMVRACSSHRKPDRTCSIARRRRRSRVRAGHGSRTHCVARQIQEAVAGLS